MGAIIKVSSGHVMSQMLTSFTPGTTAETVGGRAIGATTAVSATIKRNSVEDISTLPLARRVMAGERRSRRQRHDAISDSDVIRDGHQGGANDQCGQDQEVDQCNPHRFQFLMKCTSTSPTWTLSPSATDSVITNARPDMVIASSSVMCGHLPDCECTSERVARPTHERRLDPAERRRWSMKPWNIRPSDVLTNR